MYKQIPVKTLHKQGVKKSQIAKQLGCHRNTVNNVLDRDSVSDKQTTKRQSIFDPYKDKLKELYEKEVTRFRIHEILNEEYKIDATYDTLRKYMRKHFPKPVPAYGVQQTTPGEVAEVYFGYLGMLPGPNGRLVKTWGIVIVLAYSRVGYYDICYDQKLGTLCKKLENAFTYFNGVPLRLKIDNMRAAILENQHYDLQFNQDFLEFANHYATVITPCTPYSPEQKGKVESGVKYMQMNFVSGRDFKDDIDLKAKLIDWMDNYANKRVHGTTKKVPAEILETQERPTLQPLPEEPFAFFNMGIRKVKPNCHISFENNYYSVPFSLVGREVTVRWNDALVRIISQGEQVALHLKAQGEGNYVTVRSHMPDYKIYSESERQVKYETQMREIGESAHEYFRMLLRVKPRYWIQTVRGILGLCREYSCEEINLSLKRAFYYKATDVITIKHIFEKKLYHVEPEPVLPKVAEEVSLMGRDLSYYVVIYDANSLPAPA